MTTKTNIEAVAMSDEQKKQIAAIVHRDCTLIPGANFYTAAELAIQATVAQLNRALLASKPAVPEGWKLIRVNEYFDALMAALERAESKGYLPDAMAEEWGNFACDENVFPAPASPSGEDAAEQSAAPMAGPIYQTQMVGNAWIDASREEYERTAKCHPQWARVIYVGSPPRASEQADEAVTVTPAMVKAAMPWLTGLQHMRKTDKESHVEEAIRAAILAARAKDSK